MSSENAHSDAFRGALSLDILGQLGALFLIRFLMTVDGLESGESR